MVKIVAHFSNRIKSIKYLIHLIDTDCYVPIHVCSYYFSFPLLLQLDQYHSVVHYPIWIRRCCKVHSNKFNRSSNFPIHTSFQNCNFLCTPRTNTRNLSITPPHFSHFPAFLMSRRGVRKMLVVLVLFIDLIKTKVLDFHWGHTG